MLTAKRLDMIIYAQHSANSVSHYGNVSANQAARLASFTRKVIDRMADRAQLFTMSVSRIKKEDTDGRCLPLALKLRVKNLYIIGGKSHHEIAADTGMTPGAIATLCSRNGWTGEKRKREAQMVKKSDARIESQMSEAVEAISSEAQEIALSGLERARDAVKRKGKDAAKNFQSWTGGVRNLVQVIRAIENPGSGDAQPSGPAINFFFAPAAPAAASEPKRVEAVEVEARPVQ